jgi:hypothetical protein
MRPKFRAAALILAATMALGSTTALAANDDATTITGVNGATAEFVQESEEKMTVTYTDNNVQEGTQYLLLMVTCNNLDTVAVEEGEIKGTPNYTVSDSSILYIDQATASAGTVTFTNVYPSSVQDSVILIASQETGLVIAAIVDAAYLLGDVNGDGEVTNADLVVLSQRQAGLYTLTGNALLAADINRDGEVTNADLVILSQYQARILQSLENLGK